jgi:hypothetical protein
MIQRLNTCFTYSFSHYKCITNMCKVDTTGTRVCMVDCTTAEPCTSSTTSHCGGHGQCDGATAYCKDHECFAEDPNAALLMMICPASTCSEKKSNGEECAGHTSCLSDWCKEEGGQRFCATKLEAGDPCEGDQSVSGYHVSFPCTYTSLTSSFSFLKQVCHGFVCPRKVYG